eukprot:Sspe_Gene.65053::Locus_38522_Transcript_1_1_Confidence_1.000_Length_393::g.65053::m.65053
MRKQCLFNQETGKRTLAEVRKEPSHIDDVPSPKAGRVQGASFFRQLAYLSSREAHSFIRDKAALRSRFGATVVLSLLSGLAFQGAGGKWGDEGDVPNHYGALVFFAITQLMMSVQPLLLS